MLYLNVAKCPKTSKVIQISPVILWAFVLNLYKLVSFLNVTWGVCCKGWWLLLRSDWNLSYMFHPQILQTGMEWCHWGKRKTKHCDVAEVNLSRLCDELCQKNLIRQICTNTTETHSYYQLSKVVQLKQVTHSLTRLIVRHLGSSPVSSILALCCYIMLGVLMTVFPPTLASASKYPYRWMLAQAANQIVKPFQQFQMSFPSHFSICGLHQGSLHSESACIAMWDMAYYYVQTLFVMSCWLWLIYSISPQSRQSHTMLLCIMEDVPYVSPLKVSSYSFQVVVPKTLA